MGPAFPHAMLDHRKTFLLLGTKIYIMSHTAKKNIEPMA
jgi:hypothetical protein